MSSVDLKNFSEKNQTIVEKFPVFYVIELWNEQFTQFASLFFH